VNPLHSNNLKTNMPFVILNKTFDYFRIVTRVGANDRKYKGVRFPAGMAIQGNIWALHRDPEFWEDAEEFRPERCVGYNVKSVQ